MTSDAKYLAMIQVSQVVLPVGTLAFIAGNLFMYPHYVPKSVNLFYIINIKGCK